MDHGELERNWPFLFHMTSLENLPSIRAHRTLFPAEALIAEADKEALLSKPRPDDLNVRFNGFQVVVRNQQPLDPSCIELDEGWSIASYVRALNAQVFFWPGTADGPNASGERMARRHSVGRLAVTRIPTRSLVTTNSSRRVHVSIHNTGAAWLDGDRKSRRGSDSFQSLEQFGGDVAGIVEVSFEGAVGLPLDTSVAQSLAGPWLPLNEAH